jgi:hypothetical protein
VPRYWVGGFGFADGSPNATSVPGAGTGRGALLIRRNGK